jgi:sugar/nucleoside kinase (ribokinase family)
MGVLALGALALDTIESPAGCVHAVLGGAGAYFALAARLFTEVRLLGAVGEDMPSSYLEMLTQRGVDISGITRLAGDSLRWHVRYADDFESSTTLRNDLNVMAGFQAEHTLTDAEYVYLANLPPAVQLAMLDTLEKSRFVGMDTNATWLGEPALREVIGRVDALFMTEAELRQYTDDRPLPAARRLLDDGPRVVFVKRGRRGAWAFSKDQMLGIGAWLTSVVDPTGAGDAFAGGVMGYLASCDDVSWPKLKKAMIHGNAVASFAVEQFGVSGLLNIERADVEQRVAGSREASEEKSLYVDG